MKVLKAIWEFMGRSSLTFHLLLWIVVDLLVGFFFFRAHPDLFEPLSRMMIWEWINTVGITYPAATWWFIIFMALLGLLVANTIVCTANRIAALVTHGPDSSGMFTYLLKFSPHIMHLGFILILGSYLLSYVGGINSQNNILVFGKTVLVPGSEMKLQLDKMEMDYYKGMRLTFYRGQAINERMHLTFTNPDGSQTHKILRRMSPVWHQGYSFHVKSFFPSSKTGYKRKSYVNVIIRKDPGITLFFIGTIVFSLGLLGYLIQHIRRHLRRG
ncbi:MAG: hypothetical protein J7M32_03985 [Deltaproteobacteria bacterium]|nr:hypothetical protein [Deltaproteobacteria bacterium]